MVQPEARQVALAGTGARWRAIGWPASLLLLGACAALGPPVIETSRVYENVSEGELYEQTLQALRASELEVTETDRASGTITAAARFEQRNWADCPPPERLVQDRDDRTRRVAAREDYRRVELTASVQDGPQGATLTLAPAFSAVPVSALATTPGCRTTGALERHILAAVAEQA
jgi:hypothetical protein